MYSLVNAPVVARDLARHPRGAAVAHDLLHVLTLDDGALAELDRAPRPRHVAAGPLPVRERQALELLAATRTASEAAGLAAWSAALPLLERAPLGGRAELVAWLRTELLAGCWEGTGDLAVLRHPHGLDAVVAGVVATYDGRPDDVAAGAWRRRVADSAPATVDDTATAGVLAAVGTAGVGELAAAAARLREARAAGWSWAAAMHDACWAVEVTGRTRAAAVAQLTAVTALPAGTAPAAVAAVTAAVHGSVVADVLDAGTVAALCRPLLSSLR